MVVTIGQLKDAALATLEIQRRALDKQMSLRDASAYNIQFHRGRPLLIDTLDLEFDSGLGVLTGETGAGKSILLDALGLALGARADSNGFSAFEFTARHGEAENLGLGKRIMFRIEKLEIDFIAPRVMSARNDALVPPEIVALAREHADTEGLAFVHPFDDPDVIAGQGTWRPQDTTGELRIGVLEAITIGVFTYGLEDLPDRPISAEPNFVTPEGLARKVRSVLDAATSRA